MDSHVTEKKHRPNRKDNLLKVFTIFEKPAPVREGKERPVHLSFVQNEYTL